MRSAEKEKAQTVTRDELGIRLTAFSADVNEKISMKASSSYLKRVFDTLTEDQTKMQEDIDNRFYENRKAMRVYDDELKKFGSELSEAFKQIETKVPLTDGKKIWANFQRFAEYNDLKDLYGKIMPEIGKFEDRMIAFDLRIVQQERILHRFDELMSTKASKI